MKKNLIIVLAIAQVVFLTDMDCKNCQKKIQENIAFEKGVKDLSTDLGSKTVKATFNTAKTDTIKLGKALNKLGYSAEVIDYKEVKK